MGGPLDFLSDYSLQLPLALVEDRFEVFNFRLAQIASSCTFTKSRQPVVGDANGEGPQLKDLFSILMDLRTGSAKGEQMSTLRWLASPEKVTPRDYPRALQSQFQK